MENKKEKMMDIERYKELISEKESVMKRAQKLTVEIQTMVKLENIEVGNKIRDLLLDVFTIEELYLPEWRKEYDLTGKYEEVRREIRYELDITRYLIDKYANEFKGKSKLHRGAKHYIHLQLDYNVISKKFYTKLETHGLYSVFRDAALSRANFKMFEEAENLFNGKALELEDLQSKFIKVKEIFDNWSGYYVTEELSSI